MNNIIKQEDQSYDSKYRNNTYDIYTPINNNKNTLIIWLHGGSFVSGNSKGMRNLGPMLAYKGYTVCAMNYAYAPEKSFPTQIIQIDEMISYAITNFGSFNKLVLGGDSAGANLVAAYSTLYRNKDKQNKLKIGLQTQKEIEALLLFCGPYDFTEDYNNPQFKEYKKFMNYIGWSYLGKRKWFNTEISRLASPLLNIDTTFPPTYLTDGKKYSFLWQGRKLEQELLKNNINVKSRYFEDMYHEFQFDYKQFPQEAFQVYEDVLFFLEEELSKSEKS